MSLVTLASAAPSFVGGAATARGELSLRLALGVVSVGFGLYIAHQVELGDGLFWKE